MKASPDYNTREDNDVVHYKMIEHMDDILHIIKATPLAESKVQHSTHLIHKDNDMEDILWQIYEARYIPQISYQAGRITWLCVEVNDHKFIIKTNTDRKPA